MSAARRTRSSLLPLSLALAVTLSCAAQAAPADTDYEAITPASRAAPVSVPSSDPPGLAGSPLSVPDHPLGPHPRMRFVLRDGSALVAQVLAFDGQMYALWSAHSTLLARKDLFVSVTPIVTGHKAHPATDRVHAPHGTRGL